MTHNGSEVSDLRESQSRAGAGDSSAMFGAPPAPAGPPEEVYATQLSQLNDMGFFDAAENIRALQATGGNVHAAVERLLSGGGGAFA